MSTDPSKANADLVAITLYALLILLGLIALAQSSDFDNPEPFNDEPTEICGTLAP